MSRRRRTTQKEKKPSLIQQILAFFGTDEKSKDVKDYIGNVKDAAQKSNYSEAASRAFFALEAMGESYVQVKREPATTAREYSKLLVESGTITMELLEPIIQRFELATYSQEDITFEDYQEIETSLEQCWEAFKKGGVQTGKKKKGSAKSGAKKRKRRTTGSGSVAAEKRRRRKQ